MQNGGGRGGQTGNCWQDSTAAANYIHTRNPVTTNTGSNTRMHTPTVHVCQPEAHVDVGTDGHQAAIDNGRLSHFKHKSQVAYHQREEGILVF